MSDLMQNNPRKIIAIPYAANIMGFGKDAVVLKGAYQLSRNTFGKSFTLRVADLHYLDTILAEAMSGQTTYATVDYLAAFAGCTPEKISDYLEKHDHLFRKSVMKTSAGKVAYMRNSPFAAIKDFSNAFRQACYEKYVP
jgi:hypothetical protein